MSKDTEPLFLQINPCRESQSEGYVLQSSVIYKWKLTVVLVGTDVVLDPSWVDFLYKVLKILLEWITSCDSFIDMDRFNMLDSAMQIKVNYLQSVKDLALDQ